MTIKFHSEARKEFFEAAEYYEEQVVALGMILLVKLKKYWMSLNNSQPLGLKSRILKKGSWFLVFLME